MNSLVLCLLLVLFVGSCCCIEVGQPKYKPQFSAAMGVQIKAADVEVPFAFDEDESEELFLLSEGFVCPGQSSSLSCLASSSCSCDYATTSCSDLSSCCRTADANLWASACNDDGTSPTSWLVLQPGQTLNVTAPPNTTASSPIYLRYHPSSDSSCRGFGLSVLAPFDERGAVLSLSQTVVYYVSWTNARPERDSKAAVLSARPGQSYIMGRPRFCPSYDSDSAQTNGFFGASNNRTAFIAVYSVARDAHFSNVASEVTVELFETPEVSSIATQVSETGSATSIAVTNQQTIVISSSIGDFTYTHIGSSCANLVVDAHANSEQATTSIFADYTENFVRWTQTGPSAASSITINICPDETLYFTVMTTAATNLASSNDTLTFVTAFTDPTIALLNINEVNPNLFGPLLVGAKAVRMICDSNNYAILEWGSSKPIFTTGDGRQVATCTSSYMNSNTPECQIYPIVNRQNASLLWPAPPIGILAVQSYTDLLTDELSASIGEMLSSRLRFAVILQQVVTPSKYKSSVGREFRRWDQFAECSLEYSGTLVSSTGNRVFGKSNPLGPLGADQLECDPTMFQATLTRLQTSADWFNSRTFRDLETREQCTQMLQEMQVALTTDFSTCIYTPQEIYLTPYINTINCSTTDACCPVSDQYFRYFYDYCDSGIEYLVHPKINYDVIEEVGGDVTCSTALSLETTTSQAFISSGADAVTNIPCMFGQGRTDQIRRQMEKFYSDCRTAVAGPFDRGMSCKTIDDCPVHPQMACLPVISSNLDNPFLSSQYRRAKMCQAPTAVFDELLLQCLLDNMPELGREKLNTTFVAAGLNGTFSENLEAYGTINGCVATGPSFLQTHAAVNSLELAISNPAGDTHCSCFNEGTCPYPVTCIDSFCELSQGCTYPWGCNTQWSPYIPPTSKQTCTSLYRCNFVSPGETSPSECTGDEATCQAQCEALIGEGFCGYCDNATGFCYVATNSDGEILGQSQCTTASSAETCFIQDLGSLVTSPCDGLGSCNHFDDSSNSMKAVTAAECASAPGLCLTTEGSIMFPRTAGCLGFVQPNNLGCDDQRAVKTDSGCLYDTSFFPTAGSCIGQPDPIIQSQTVRGWLDIVDTEEECTGNEDMFVCQVPYQKDTPMSGTANFNNRTVCESRGGTFTSPYRWENATFIAGSNVALKWMNVEAVAAAQWTTRQSFPKTASVLDDVVRQLQCNANANTADCFYNNIVTVSGLAAACQADPESEENREACSGLWQVDRSEVPIQHLGLETVCDVAEIPDTKFDYASTYNVPPVILAFTNNTNLKAQRYSMMDHCARLDGDLKSNSKFLQPRKRLRETAFFIARQDSDVVPLATLSSNVVVNGLMITDAVSVAGNNMTIDEAWLCVQVRPDFQAEIVELYPNRSDWTSFTMTLGVHNEWAVNPLKSSNTTIKSTWLTPEGELLSDVIGNRVPENMNVSSLVQICRLFEHFELDSDRASFFVGVLTFYEDPEDVPNGYDTTQTVWLYITACMYLAPVIFLWLPLVVRSVIGKEHLTVPLVATFFLSMFLIFRSALVFGMAAGTIEDNSVTEFALTDIAVWCELSAVCLLGLVINVALSSSSRLKSNKGFFGSKVQQAIFVLSMLVLLVVFIAFVGAYSGTGDSSSGITDPMTSCEGRVAEGTTKWTTRRILRFAYECLVVVLALGVGGWLVWICWAIGKKTRGSTSNTQLFRLTGSTAMLALMILVHSIIALILIVTEWNNFIFGIIMLYVTELVPLFAFFIVALWKNIIEFTSISLSSNNASASVGTGSNTPATSGLANTYSAASRINVTQHDDPFASRQV